MILYYIFFLILDVVAEDYDFYSTFSLPKDAKLIYLYTDLRNSPLGAYTTDRFGNEDSAFKAVLNKKYTAVGYKDYVKLNPGKSFTLMFWIQLLKVNNVNTSESNIIIRFIEESVFLQIQVEPKTNYLVLKLFDNSTVYATNYSLSGEWTFITFVRNESSLIYFVNGEFINSLQSMTDLFELY